MKVSSSAIVVLAALLFFAAPSGFSQSSSFFNQRDDQYRLLDEAGKEAYEVAREDFERQKGVVRSTTYLQY